MTVCEVGGPGVRLEDRVLGWRTVYEVGGPCMRLEDRV